MSADRLADFLKTVFFHKTRSIMLLLILLVMAGKSLGAVFYVKPDGSDQLDGTTWGNAKTTISATLLVAGEGDQIWVAAGHYKERLVNRSVGETAINVALYGGFAGHEFSLDERDISANPAIIDGMRGGIVITLENGAGPATRIDGFYITGGYGIHGGGIKTITSAPVIANNIIRDNLTNGLGAGISVWGYRVVSDEHPLITGNTIVDNFSYEDAGDGGGIGITYSSPVISQNVIARNRANQNGGAIAIYHNSAPKISGNYLLANSANILKGGSNCNLGGGAVFATAWDLNCVPVSFAASRPEISNNVIAANGANRGGGILLMETDGTATLTNNTIVGNSGAGIYWQDSYLLLENSLIAYNSEGLKYFHSPTAGVRLYHNNIFGNELQHRDTNYVGLENATGLNGNISAEPRMISYKTGDFHIQPDSPCVDAGDSLRATSLLTDIEGDSRSKGGGVDIGADESDGVLRDETAKIVYVSKVGDDDLDGSSWAQAKLSVGAGVATVLQTGGEVWVAQGVYKEHITLSAFAHLYGGFKGLETERDQRDWSANKTALDGAGQVHVVKVENAGYRVSTLEGFTVQNGGVYTGGDIPVAGEQGHGGGIRIWVSGPDISHNTIERNAVGFCPNPWDCHDSFGAGVAGYLSTAVLQENIIQDNELWDPVGGSGGGLSFVLSQPLIEKNLITRNHAEQGSGIYAEYSTPFIADNVIEENSMYVTPLTIGNGLLTEYGAVYCWLCTDFTIERNILRNNTAAKGAGVIVLSSFQGKIESNLFDSNVAWDYSGLGAVGWGGGLHVEVTLDPDGDIRILNNTFVNNTAADQGGAIAMDLLSDAIVIANNILAFNSSGVWRNSYLTGDVRVLEYNNLFNGGVDYINLSPGSTDTQIDPLFNNYALADYRLSPDSPCIESGSESELPSSHLDLNSTIRIQDADGNGHSRIDKGAHEYPGPHGVHVSPSSGLATSESGLTDYFEVYLLREPLEPVSIALVSSDLSESVVDKQLLTFTADDWYRIQKVAIQGVDDLLDDGNQQVEIQFTTISADPLYNEILVPSVNTINIDDDDFSACVGTDIELTDKLYTGLIYCQASNSLRTNPETGTVVVSKGADVTFSSPSIGLNRFLVEHGGIFLAE